MSEYLAYDVVAILLAPILLAILALGLLALRRRLLRRIGGTVDCGLRAGPGTPWRLGVASYNGTSLRWYRIFGITLRPDREISRRGVVVTGRRSPDAREVAVLSSGTLVVTCDDRGELLELAMSEAAATGFLAWLEAAPPGPPCP